MIIAALFVTLDSSPWQSFIDLNKIIDPELKIKLEPDNVDRWCYVDNKEYKDIMQARIDPTYPLTIDGAYDIIVD